MSNKKIKVAAYTRINTQDGGLEESRSSQIGYYSELIQNNPQWEYVGVYVDDVSGVKEIREEFERMLGDAQAGNIDIIITNSISRFTQSKVRLVEIIRKLTALGVDIIFEEQGINTMSDDGKLLLSVLEDYIQADSKLKSEESRQRIRKNFEEGKGWFHNLYGYNFINRSLEPNNKQAAIIRRIFDEYVRGLSPEMIADKLNNDNIMREKDRPWNSLMISRIVANERYAGHSLLQKTYKTDASSKVAINQGELPMSLVENTHPAIVSQELFDKAQKMREIRGIIYKYNSGKLPVDKKYEDKILAALKNSKAGLHKLYGYDYDGIRLTPNKNQANVVCRIFDEYNRGISPYIIADKLETDGAPAMLGGKWNANRVSKIIGYEEYAGHRVIRKRISATGEVVTYCIENTHEAIISQDIFDTAQDMRKLRSELFSTVNDKLYENVNGELRPLYGFDFVDGEFVSNKSEAAVVKRVFEEYIRGASTFTIAEELNNDGFLTVYGNKWHKKAIEKLLHNSFYTKITGDDALKRVNKMRQIRSIAFAKKEDKEKLAMQSDLKKAAKAFERGKKGLHPIFGFDYINCEIVVNALQADVVIKIFDEYNSGTSPKLIAEKLNKGGIQTVHNENWNINSISRLIINELYIEIVGNDIFDQAQEMKKYRSETFKA